MLTYEETSEHFVIEDTTDNYKVKYSKDLSTIQIGNFPPRKTILADKDWFNKYYKDKFK